MWVRGGSATGGNVVLAADERRVRMAEALVSGVSIDSSEWAVLSRLSRKFLVSGA
jgi:LDH2 family malate/lactate/ureidoglycolate dehydrogenase